MKKERTIIDVVKILAGAASIYILYDNFIETYEKRKAKKIASGKG